MGIQTRNGFTIIEVMLFLAVSGALAVGILVGSGAAINQQRYRDSVNTFKSLIQEQYSRVASVENGEDLNGVCTRAGSSLNISDPVSQAQRRGTSDCLILGRFILIKAQEVQVSMVVGRGDLDAVATDDIAALRGFGFATYEPEDHDIEWGAKIVNPTTSSDYTGSILIVRSPLTGSILTYVRDEDMSQQLIDMIGVSYQTQKDLCVDSEDISVASRRMAVRIAAKAANQSAIEVPLESDSVCGR